MESKMTDVWYMLQDANRYVYHYTCAATLTDHILHSGRLRFSRFQNLNDPREAKIWSFDYCGNADAPEFEIQAIQKELNERLKLRWRVGCFVSDVYEALVTKEREIRGEDIWSAVYERGHSRPRMWAQYGEDYKGACLVFDQQKLDSKIRSTANSGDLIIHAARVEYTNPPVVHSIVPNAFMISCDELTQLGIDKFAKAHVQRYWKELFFTKAEDWKQEREFRWLVRGDGDEDFLVDIRDSLVGILLGDRFPVGRRAAVGNYALANEVSLADMEWRNGVPRPIPTDARILTNSS
jgi:hypothetical protein